MLARHVIAAFTVAALAPFLAFGQCSNPVCEVDTGTGLQGGPIGGGTNPQTGTISLVTPVATANGGLGINAGTSTGFTFFSSGSVSFIQSPLPPGNGGTGQSIVGSTGFPHFTLGVGNLIADPIPVANGGLGIASGTQGGMPFFSGSTTISSSGLLTTNGVMLGGGKDGPSTTAVGAADQVLVVPHAGGAPAFGPVNLGFSNAVSGQLREVNGGTGADFSSAPAGSVPFQGSSSSLTQDSSNLNYSTTTHTLAVGASPAALVPPGVLAPLNDAGGQVFNVKAFGARGDGTCPQPAFPHCDTPAINAAISAAAALNGGAGGGVVFFPPGTYLIDSTIQLGNGTGAPNPAESSYQNISIIGSAQSSAAVGNQSRANWQPLPVLCVIKANPINPAFPTGNALFEVEGPIENIVIKDIGFDGNSIAGAGGSSAVGVLNCIHMIGSTIDNVQVINPQSGGTSFQMTVRSAAPALSNGSNDNLISRLIAECHTSGCLAAVIGPDIVPPTGGLDPASNRFTDCGITSNGGTALQLRYCDSSSFRDSYINGTPAISIRPPVTAPAFPDKWLFNNMWLFGYLQVDTTNTTWIPNFGVKFLNLLQDKGLVPGEWVLTATAQPPITVSMASGSHCITSSASLFTTRMQQEYISILRPGTGNSFRSYLVSSGFGCQTPDATHGITADAAPAAITNAYLFAPYDGTSFGLLGSSPQQWVNGTSPSDVAVGLLTIDKFYNKFGIPDSGASRHLYGSTAGSSVSNTNTKTVFANGTGFLQPYSANALGTVLDYTVSGKVSSINTPNVTIFVDFVGVTSLYSATWNSIGALSNVPWSVECKVYIDGIGSSGAYQLGPCVSLLNGKVPTSTTGNTSNNGVDLTAGNAFQAQAQWSVASPSNSITELQVSVVASYPSQ